MAVKDHIKIASSELAKAADLARREIDQLRTQQADIKKNRDTEIASITQHMGRLENEVMQTNDSASKNQARSNISTLQRQLAERKSESDDMIKSIEDNIRSKESMIQSLETQAKSLR